MTDDVLQQQIDYYRARAGEYDEWFYRVGRYDHGEAQNKLWFEEARQVMDALHRTGVVDNALELAAGTGIWTEQLLKIAQHITGVDASPEVLAINRKRLNSDKVVYQQADLFQWQPEKTYDLVFFSFWLSHVPPDKLDIFLKVVYQATNQSGRVFIVDSRPAPTSSANNHQPYEADSVYHTRKLNDGREFKIFKIFYEPDALQEKLDALGFDADVRVTENFFIYADAVKR
jgi:ubiquinone/menaquinone biosynthesis C-methylase UbiE